MFIKFNLGWNNNIGIYHVKHRLISNQKIYFMSLKDISINHDKEISGHIIAKEIFERINGIISISIHQYNLEITKAEMFTWAELDPQIRLILEKNILEYQNKNRGLIVQ